MHDGDASVLFGEIHVTGETPTSKNLGIKPFSKTTPLSSPQNTHISKTSPHAFQERHHDGQREKGPHRTPGTAPPGKSQSHGTTADTQAGDQSQSPISHGAYG